MEVIESSSAFISLLIEIFRNKNMENEILLENLQECFVCLDNEISNEDKEYIKEHDAIEFHHTLGRWIRNTFCLWNKESGLKSELLEKGLTHPDDMSNYIIEEYQKHLKEYGN